MSRRDRSASTGGSGAYREKAGKIVFLPQGVELELVGIIGPGGIPGIEAVESFFLDGDEDLRVLFESLVEAASDPAAWRGDDFVGGISPNDGPPN